ncbi:MAG: hypothetical protein GY940_01310 [bacterium]|nr:hypothetical protein [bacterium]
MTSSRNKRNTHSLLPFHHSCKSYSAVLFSVIIFLIASMGLSAANWTQINRDPGGTFRAVCYGGGQFVAVGDAGLIRTSSNGSSWTNRSSGTTRNIYAITYGGGQYVAVGYHGIILTSSNGSSWTERNPYTANGLSFTSVAYNGTNLYVAAGVSDPKNGINSRLVTSPDGITWTERSSGTSAEFRGMCYGNGKFVAAGSSGNIMYSSDGINWTVNGVTGVNNYSAIYAGGQFMLGGQNGRLYTSTNGTSWTKRSTGTTNYFMGLTHNGSNYAGSGNSDGYTCSMALISATGASWVRDKTPDYSTLLGIASGGGAFVAVGTRRLIIRNTDAGVGDGVGCGSPPPPPPSGDTITVTSPNGGESWAVGTTQNITWTGSKTYSYVEIQYTVDDGANWTTETASTPDDGSYSWTIPNNVTNLAKVWMKGYHSGGNAVDRSDATFKIVPASQAPPQITITYPNGGESIAAGSAKAITWTTGGGGTVTSVRIEYTLDGGNNWTVLTTGTANDGNYTWNVPTTTTSNARIWVKGFSDSGNDIDFSDNYFSIIPSVTVTSPNGGESWDSGSSHNITWGTVGYVGNVKIEYSTNTGSSWNSITSSTANDGSFPWNLPTTASDNYLVRVTEVSGHKVSDTSNSIFSVGGTPELAVDKTSLNFGGIKGGSNPTPQPLLISNAGGGTLGWSISSNAGWLTTSATSGTNSTSVNVSVDPSSLAAGTHNGTLTVTDTSADGASKTVSVILTLINSSQDQPPFGSFATPIDGTANVSGSLAATGWALDDVEVESVKIYRVVNGEDSYIGDAVFVEGSRPDVEQAYPSYPLSSRAGWGYMVLTNFLPDGQLTLKVIVKDVTGYQVVLGTRTVTVDNANAVKPFGAIDSPTQGGESSGNKYRNNGWALTPQPNTIPTDGSTINVYIDGVAIGKATYNLFRSDIAGFFPGYNNTNGSWGYFDIDTTGYSNGTHTIQWSVADNANNSDGIGSRFFVVKNVASDSAADGQAIAPKPNMPMPPAGLSKGILEAELHNIGPDYSQPIRMKKGYGQQEPAIEVYPGEDGTLNLDMNELDRVRLNLDSEHESMLNTERYYSGYMLVNGELRRLPIGSTLDAQNGIFYWQAGPGFLGQYQLIFFITENGQTLKKEVRLNILPGKRISN